GYFHDPSLRPDFALEARRICVLDVSDESNGHCTGVGASDATTRRLFDKFNYVASYINAITSMAPEDVRIPAVMENDKLAVQFCIHTSFGVDRTDAKRMRIVRIPNTLHLEHIQLSEAYLGELSRYSGLTAESEPTPMAFDENGNLF
ncbi:MAG: hypothetical protein LBH09_06420, partial [Peptococcaceae bacterium]|nr:hypothetical protein [Peptococcaceae bacterium]